MKLGWIRIEDEIPGEGKGVVYYFKLTGVSRGRFTSDGIYQCFYGCNGWLCDDVTHWMPDTGGDLPEPPEEGL